ncbi:MAG TPA: Mth938-like domain-containing protein [Steroidobacteraceae bacterium]|jgi:uncharacterized protein
MKFTLEGNSSAHLIRSYAPGEIRIGERVIHSSCVVTADTLLENWEPATLADLQVAHLERIFALAPEVVLLGTGMSQRFPPAAVRAAFSERRIGLEAMDLGAACRTYNVLVGEERNVAAALLLG